MPTMQVRSLHQQRGVVLIVSLMILLVMTIIGVTALTTSTFQSKMAGNAQERTAAFHAAETAVQRARQDTGALAQALGGAEVTRVYDNYDGQIGVTSSVATISSLGTAAIPNRFSSDLFSALAYSITGDGRRLGSKAAASTVEAISRVAPGGS